MRVDAGDGGQISVEAVANDQGHALALLRCGTFGKPDVFFIWSGALTWQPCVLRGFACRTCWNGATNAE
jgi:hypothetical protein